MPLVVVGLNHRTSPVALREQFAFSEETVPGTLRRLRDEGLAQEGVIVSTCNRVELYAAVETDGADRLAVLREFLLAAAAYRGEVGDAFYGYGEPESLRHLFRVASGLDSMVLGETEVLGQLKRAYHLALHHRLTGVWVNKAFQRAFNVAKQIRTHTNIQRGNVSVASAAVDLAERIFASLKGRRVMVIGAGDTSEKTARALAGRGTAPVLVSNRSHGRAVALAEALAGRAIRFEDWEQEFAHLDILISSTSAPHFVVTRAQLEGLVQKRGRRPLLLIDIAVPRDIDPEVNLMSDVYLYNVDDLQAIADEGLRQRQEEIARCEALIQEGLEAHMAATAGRFQSPHAR